VRVSEMFDLAGKAGVVTGASGGIGRGIALVLAEAGAAIVVAYHGRKAAADELVAEIEGRGGRAVSLGADITKAIEAERLVAACVEAFGGIDILVNNAGAYPMAALLEMTEEAWDEMLTINLRSAFLCTQAAGRQMIDGGGGSIVNIASIEAENPAPMHAHYCTAKAGLAMLTQASAAELGRHGIRVNTISPGLIWREGIDEAWPDGVERWRNVAPLTRLGTPEDVGKACLFLVSDASEWITGANLRVDGGVMTSQIF